MPEEKINAHQKALKVNLDQRWYGSFAEIGAGQEVVRWFFRVGGASGTVAKSMSAYDMAVSDAIYGSTERYVSRSRLQLDWPAIRLLTLEPLVLPSAGWSALVAQFGWPSSANNLCGCGSPCGPPWDWVDQAMATGRGCFLCFQ